MAVIKGNTFPVRDKLAALGGRWAKALNGWIVPDAVAEQAMAIVAAAGTVKARSGRQPRVCATCGCKINYGRFCGKCEFR